MINNTFRNVDYLMHADLSLQGKPENLVSNWACTSLYKKNSLMGVIWKAVMWVTGQEDIKLRQTIRGIEGNTAKITQDYNVLVKEAKNQNWWTKHSFEDYHKIFQKYIRASEKIDHKVSEDKIKLIANWAWGSEETQAVLAKIEHLNADIVKLGGENSSPSSPLNAIAQKIIQLTDHGQNLAQSMAEIVAFEPDTAEINTLKRAQGIWKSFQIDIPFELLYRELTHPYPANDADFQTYVSKYVNKSTNKSPELIYGPLASIAVNLADKISQQKIKLVDVDTMLNNLLKTENQATKNLLLNMVRYDLYLRTGDIATPPKEYVDALPIYARKILRDHQNQEVNLGIQNSETRKVRNSTDSAGQPDSNIVVTTTTTTWESFEVHKNGARTLMEHETIEVDQSPY